MLNEIRDIRARMAEIEIEQVKTQKMLLARGLGDCSLDLLVRKVGRLQTEKNALGKRVKVIKDMYLQFVEDL